MCVRHVRGGAASPGRASSAGVTRAALGVFAAVCVLGTVVAGWVYDSSWDGRDYQQYSIMEIAEGFNPIHDIREPQSGYRPLLLNHYTKLTWYVGASLRNLTSRIETAKALNWLLAWAAACLVFVALERREQCTFRDSIAWTALVVLNPVITAQLFTHYVDGVGASVITMFIAAGFLYACAPSRTARLDLALVVFIGVNVKFTILVTLLLLAPVLLGILLVHGVARTEVGRLALALSLAGIAGVSPLGYAPHVRNTLEHGNPLYPTLGSDHEINADQILAPQIHSAFLEQGRLARLAVGVFGTVQNDPNGWVSGLKSPLSVSRSEFGSFLSPDVRIGGFGPLFGLGFLLAMGYVASRTGGRRWALVLGVVLLAPALVHGGGWWARFSPQLWLIPLLMMIAASDGGRTRTPHRVAGLLKRLAMAVLFVNAVGVAWVAWSTSVANSVSTRARIVQMRGLVGSGEHLLLYRSHLIATEYRLDEEGIPYETVEEMSDLPCPVPFTDRTWFSVAECGGESGS